MSSPRMRDALDARLARILADALLAELRADDARTTIEAADAKTHASGLCSSREGARDQHAESTSYTTA